MKKSLLSALLLLLAGTLLASPVTPKRAAAVAQSFWQSINSSPKSVSLNPVAWQYDAIYLYAAEGGGYVLVAADDAVRPILGYSATAVFDPDSLPPALQQWLQGYQSQIDLQRAAKRPYPAAAEEWAALEQGLAPKDASDEVVEPLIATRWDQDYPYNGYCPSGTVTGCAATAQAQVMYFWQHPAFGKGSHAYTHNRYGRQEADFAHTAYDWAGMPLQASMNSSDREKEAVATLMYHCGVSLEMGYGTAAQGGSSAAGLTDMMEDIPCINHSLRDYFYYDPSMHVIEKNHGFTNDQWRDTLMGELRLGHPIVYTGQGPAGGHGFVCDGYDSRGYMHFNFGWSGIGDGYFPVDSITPGTGGVGGGSYSFNNDNSALLGLVPLYDLRVSDTLFSVDLAGGNDSLLYTFNPAMNTIWSITVDADWITANTAESPVTGWLHFAVGENNSGQERVGNIVFSQGNRQCTVRVVQNGLAPEEMCPVTVVMESTRGEGWQGGAYLSLQSENGYLYGTARLATGQRDSVVIPVAPHNLYSVWHSGGGTDRYINYYVRNQHGETLVNATYAYRTGGTHVVEWPCAHVGIDEATESHTTLYPSPVTDILHIQAEGLQKVEVMDMSGRLVATAQSSTLDLRTLPSGAYFVRIITTTASSVQRIVKK